MAYAMTAKKFAKVTSRDLTNGACRDEIENALRQREKLLRICRELDAELDGVKLPWSAAAIANAMRQEIGEYE